VALRRGRCIICRRVVKRFQLVFSRAGPPPQPHERKTREREIDRQRKREAHPKLNRAVQFFLIIRKSSLIHPGYIYPSHSPSLSNDNRFRPRSTSARSSVRHCVSRKNLAIIVETKSRGSWDKNSRFRSQDVWEKI